LYFKFHKNPLANNRMLGSKVLAETPCILNEEQKGCVKESFGCKEQLVIDTIIREQARKNNRNIYTSFIDYKMIQH
jgi:hypothetical protein